MARVKEKPLTTTAVNRFIQTVVAEVGKSDFTEYTKHIALCDIASLILPIDTPPLHEELGYVLIAPDNEIPHSKLPDTLSELKRRVDQAGTDFEREPSEEAAQKTFRTIVTKAFRAAEKEMARDATAEHVNGFETRETVYLKDWGR